VLRDAGVTHDLVVVDAGPVTSDHCRGALSIADTVYWTLDAATTLTRLAHLLSSDLIVPAQRARWVLALSATAGGALPATTREVAELVPSASGLVCLPAIRGLGRGAASALAGEQLLSALT
jgi:hypothetical protein